MRSLAMLEEGSGTKFTIWFGGKEVEFRLAVVSRRSWRGELEYGYTFISDDGKFMKDSCYSGGNTGFGISAYEMTHNDNNSTENAEYTVVTTDLQKIIKMSVQAKKDADDERLRYDKAVRTAVAEINELPIEYPIFEDETHMFVVVRSNAKYEPSYSSKFRPSFNFKRVRKDTSHECFIFLNDYYSKIGAFQKAKAVKALGPKAPMILAAAKLKIEELQAKIGTIINDCGAYQR